MVRAKFKVTGISRGEDGDIIYLNPVITGSKENEEFFNLTPAGQVTLQTINTEASKYFELNKEYYVDFTRAE